MSILREFDGQLLMYIRQAPTGSGIESTKKHPRLP